MYQLLIVGKNEEITETVVRLLRNYDKINTVSANDLLSLQAIMKDGVFDVVMNCGGFSKEEEALLLRIARANNENVKVIEHFGGGSGLLLSELKQILDI